LTGFGVSGPANTLCKFVSITPEAVAFEAPRLLARVPANVTTHQGKPQPQNRIDYGQYGYQK
jgi:hypothetical protein